MRGTPARVLGVIAVGAMVAAATAACGMSKETKAACDSIEKELESIATKAQEQVTEPGAAAKIYTDAAVKIRSEAGKADGDVADAADQVAKDLESLAKTLRQAAQGNIIRTPDTNALTKSGAALQTACNG